MSTSSAPKISQGMENNSELRKVGEEMTTGKTEEIDKDLDANQYMDIDEFMEVLRDVELITPFGKLESTPVDAAQIDDKTVELQHCYTEQSDHRCVGTGGNLRAKHTVLQHDIDILYIHTLNPGHVLVTEWEEYKSVLMLAKETARNRVEVNFRKRAPKLFLQLKQLVNVVIGASTAGVVVLALMFFLIIRKLRYETDLAQNKSWKLRYDDLHIQDRGGSGEAQSQGQTKTREELNVNAIKAVKPFTSPLFQEEQTTAASNASANTEQIFTTIGNYQDVLANDEYKIDYGFKLSMAIDLAAGMKYLHKTSVKFHGNLTSTRCVIDSHWVVKITDWGLHEFKAGQENTKSLHKMYFVIIHRVVAREDPPFRPDVPSIEMKPKYIELMVDCWNDEPEERPHFYRIVERLKKESGRGSNIIENMVTMMEKHANHLEQLVEERTRQLNEEKEKSEKILYRLLPPLVDDQLKSDNTVQAEGFEEVTIFFSDIVGFTKLASMSSRLEVETVGDAYVVVSGCPKKNGIRHASEIASMALKLLSHMTVFRVRHLPDHQLQLRIGINTGPVVAAVIGVTMPRFCLYGHTVIIASKLESTCLPLRIHVSSDSHSRLVEVGGFYLEERGQVQNKRQGLVTTYWLVGKEGFDRASPDFPLEFRSLYLKLWMCTMPVQ
ncbi:Atrial natriuretic peptide receptor 1 [Stylophora pistillata]|uniref:Atrial natriuretic peptide receptor 1 n=1 Tax=Stylophora pistillata TaxID=50429 RepID=A0A2B4RSQ2_STYPI|nr:Atrial natriuretic peptide receptor 1 [Stylophora pistillata]